MSNIVLAAASKLDVERAREFLAKSRSVDQVKDVRDKARAVELYLRTRTASLDAQNDATEIRLRAERRLGELTRELPKSGGGRPNKTGHRVRPVLEPPTLAERGIKKQDAHRWQQIAGIPEQRFEAKIAEARKKGERVSSATVVADAKRQARTSNLVEISKGNAALKLAQRFPVLLADPPWQYEHVKTESRAIENQYPTQSLAALCKLPVGKTATPDAVLFLWATSPKLGEAFAVLQAWGFTYRTCAVWVKDKIGMGYYFRQQHELLLVATRGEMPTPEPSARPSSVIEAPRGKHSAKPELVHELIERMYPELPKLEMFARSPRKGWTVWGNQA